MRTKQLFFIFGACLIGLTSCSLYRSNLKDVDRMVDKIQGTLEQPFRPAEQYKMDTIAVKDDIWLGNQSIRVNEGDPLPARFETDDGITLVSTSPVSLLQISEQITSLTGITVRVDDMILNEVKSATQGETNVSEIGGVSSNTSTELFMPAYSGKLSGLLDQIVSRFALWWRYKNGVITFYKMETRVFTIYALPVTSNMSANIAGTSSGESGGSTSASMDSSIQLDFWSQLEQAVTAMLPEGATLNIIPTNGTMTVTAPPFTLQRISQYVNSMNEKLARQVAISVKVLNVTLSDSQQSAINVTSVLNFINEKLKFDLTSTSASLEGVSSNLGMTLIPGDKHIDTTNLVIQALKTQGTTSLMTSASVTTMNNRIAPIQVSTDESYVEKIETTMNSDTTSVSITPAKINYGFTMEVLPRILDHGRLLMMFTMTLTELEEMGRATGGGTGTGEDAETSQTVVQLPKIRTRGFVQEVAMMSGATLMLTGFEQVQSSTGNDKQLFSYQNQAEKSRNVMVILMTPEVLISPLSPETRMLNV